jgi:hypothetical protein
MVGTWVGLVQPGSLSFVQLLRATSTRLALSASVCEPSVLAAKRALLAMWWCTCACWCECCMAPRPMSHARSNRSGVVLGTEASPGAAVR